MAVEDYLFSFVVVDHASIQLTAILYALNQQAEQLQAHKAQLELRRTIELVPPSPWIVSVRAKVIECLASQCEKIRQINLLLADVVVQTPNYQRGRDNVQRKVRMAADFLDFCASAGPVEF